MKTSAVTLFLATAGYVSAAAIITPRQDAQADYDRETDDLKSRGLCRAYKGAEPSYSHWQDFCDPVCAGAKGIAAQNDGTFSETCDASQATASPYFPDPTDDGLTYTFGTCKCNMPIINWAGDAFVAALPAIGQVTCAVWIEAAKSAAAILSGVNGASAAKTGLQTLWKVAKLLAKQGKKASDWEDYVKKHVAAGDACDQLDIGKLWDDAQQLSDDVFANVS
ncbi:Uu.00g098400.m01.CDS01 [Anthostomella pinea]|uniref:Uu.00g098400.m01.CDS01 n=1 Tax=Anthostomella pinea TaxID=933095 RepID=A0AAI8VCN4_9PEZI|nr:Uu.00g098400.m01.CDS01 [Anthostomella pinea]